jgi:hypothetical protein
MKSPTASVTSLGADVQVCVDGSLVQSPETGHWILKTELKTLKVYKQAWIPKLQQEVRNGAERSATEGATSPEWIARRFVFAAMI